MEGAMSSASSMTDAVKAAAAQGQSLTDAVKEAARRGTDGTVVSFPGSAFDARHDGAVPIVGRLRPRDPDLQPIEASPDPAHPEPAPVHAPRQEHDPIAEATPEPP